MQQPLYGLIGGKLGHSYSKIIHEQIADYTYDLLPLPTEAEARAFMEKRAFAAINVTIPYKQLVIPYCDEVDPKAKAIGAVNTIVNRDGKLYGYNTDYAGFAYLAKAHGVDFADKTVLILGTGGTHSTVTAVCRDGGAKEILTASRTGKDGALLYSEAMHRRDVQIIVNTTPCGMFPNVGQCLIDPKAFPALEAVLDVVYNPFRTELLLRAEDCGVTAAGGFEMLVAQAVFAAEHFTGSWIRRPSSPLSAAVCGTSWRMSPSSGCRAAANPRWARRWPSGWASDSWIWTRKLNAAPGIIFPTSLPRRARLLSVAMRRKCWPRLPRTTARSSPAAAGSSKIRPTPAPCARTDRCCGCAARWNAWLRAGVPSRKAGLP